MPATRPPETASATDEVIAAIADIELQRRETEKESGFAMSCSSALHRLHELLEHETEALRLRGPGAGHQKNIDALKIEVGRVKELAASKGQKSFPGGGRTGPRSVSWQKAPRGPARNRGRRTMGRAGGR